MKLKHLQELIKFFLVAQCRNGSIAKRVGGGATRCSCSAWGDLLKDGCVGECPQYYTL